MSELVPGGWTPKQRGTIERLDKDRAAADLRRSRPMSAAWDALIPEPPRGDRTPIFDSLAGHARFTVPNELARMFYLHSVARIRHDHDTWPTLAESTLEG